MLPEERLRIAIFFLPSALCSVNSPDVRGKPVWIGGLSVEREDALRELVASAPAGALRVLLHHHPDEVLRVSELGVDLYLARHTHGGQVALPFYGALVTLSKLGKRFESGLKRVGSTWI